MKRFSLTDKAESDLYELLDYLDQRNQTASEEMEEGFLAEFVSLADHPLLHRVRPEFAPAPVRVAIFGNYLIFYNPEDRPLSILRILHGKRNVPFILKDESEP